MSFSRAPIDRNAPRGGHSFRAYAGGRTTQARSDWTPAWRPSARAVRLGLMSLAVLGGALYLNSQLTRRVFEEAPMALDERPAREVLFLGNSRIYVNDMPRMVRDIADSAHSPIRYDMHMRSWGGATWKDHWRDEGDQALLEQPWDEVILQTQSGSFMDEASLGDFQFYGARLAKAAKSKGAHVEMMANWTMGARLFQGDAAEAAAASRRYGEVTLRETRALAERAGAGVIDLESAFAEATEAMPDIALTTDGVHATHAGTYLAALVVYGDLAKVDVTSVPWRPADVSEETAAGFRRIAARHTGQGADPQATAVLGRAR